MPLYGQGLKRGPVLRLALWANDLLSASRNVGVRADRRLPPGRILDVDEVRQLFPAVRTAGLTGAALWYDAALPDSQLLLMALLMTATRAGAIALNHVEVRELVAAGGRVRGVGARDGRDGREWSFHAPVVVNCGGPWSREIAATLDRAPDGLFAPSLAFNLLLDRPSPSSAALAVEPPGPDARVYFLHPFKGRLLAGTYHAPRPGGLAAGPPEEALIEEFLRDLNAAIPGLELTRGEVRRVLWGLLPAARPGSAVLASRPVLHDHGEAGGPRGLFSVAGVKFTTARAVAEQTLRRVLGELGAARPAAEVVVPEVPSWPEFSRLLARDPARADETVGTIVRTQAVRTLDDLLERRTDWALHPQAPVDLEQRIRRVAASHLS